MGDIITSFEAQNQSLVFITWITGVLALMALGGWIWFTFGNSKVQAKYKSLIALLCFAVLLTAGGASFFSGWALSKIDEVVFYEDGMELPGGVLTYSQVNRYYFHKDQQKSMINPTVVTGETLFLIIEGPNRKTFALSADNFDVHAIEQLLEEQLGGK